MPARLLEPGLWGAVAKATCSGGVRALSYCLCQRSGSPPVPWYCASALAVAVALLRGLVLAPIKGASATTTRTLPIYFFTDQSTLFSRYYHEFATTGYEPNCKRSLARIREAY